LIGFGGKRIDALEKISLPVSFGDQQNARIEYVTFDIVNLYYPYNAIFSRGFANKFNVAFHIGHLCMKMPALHGVITIHNSQKEARNIERAIYKSQCNINSIETAKSNTPEPSDMPNGETDLKD
jgi:16S rRNA G527 N7-methylase RsmG